MICISMQLFYFIYEGFRFGFIFYLPGISYKSGVFEFSLSPARTSQGFVVIQGLILNTSFLTSFTLVALKFCTCAPDGHCGPFKLFNYARRLVFSPTLHIFLHICLLVKFTHLKWSKNTCIYQYAMINYQSG